MIVLGREVRRGEFKGKGNGIMAKVTTEDGKVHNIFYEFGDGGVRPIYMASGE